MTDLDSRSRLSPATWVALILSIIGALNWGLVGLFEFDLVAAIFGRMSTLSRIIYVLVAAAGIYVLIDAATRLREERTHPTAGMRRPAERL